MKFLVIGCGSIGRRHAKNLLSMHHTVVAADKNKGNRKWMADNLGIPVFADAAGALRKEKPDAALVCTPPSTHVQLARQALQSGCHVFIEKPVSNSLSGIDALARLAARKRRVLQVGYNLRFCKGLQRLKEVLISGRLGRALYSRIAFSFYLPYWRPATDYRKGYTGKRKYGGGIVLEATHELDYACWLFGKPRGVSCTARKVSGLEVDTEDTAELAVEFASGTLAAVHLDFVRKDYSRFCEVVCENGALHLDMAWKDGRMSLEERTAGSQGKPNKRTLLYEPRWDTNAMYADELKAFASACGKKGKKPLKGGKPGKVAAGILDGKIALRLALAALESSAKGRAVKLA